MHEGISYLDDIDVYYYHCHCEESEYELYKDKWYKITCLLKLPNIPIHKNIYFVPHPRLDEFLKHNPEKLVDIESVSLDSVREFIQKNTIRD